MMYEKMLLTMFFGIGCFWLLSLITVGISEFHYSKKKARRRNRRRRSH